MASKRFEKGSPEWMMFQDFWKLTQRFYIPENTVEYWEEISEEADAFYRRNKDVPLSRELAIALIRALEGVGRQNRGGDLR